jgi:hypothetical protein
MGLYTEGLKVSIHRQVAKGKTVKEAYGFLTSKLSKALKSYEADMEEVISAEGNMISPQQSSLLDSLETVRSVTAAMILDLDTLRIDGWEPEA